MWPTWIRSRARLRCEWLEDRTVPSQATFNPDLAADPLGRVVTVTFDQDLGVSAPWDRFRFDLNATRPLMADGSAFVGDITGDGIGDPIISDYTSTVSFYPGLPGKPSS